MSPFGRMPETMQRRWSRQPSILCAIWLFFLMPRSASSLHSRSQISFICPRLQGIKANNMKINLVTSHDAETGNRVENDDSTTRQFTTLPRMYVGPRSISSQSSIVLGEDAMISLTMEQSHYVTKVMRIGTKQKRDNRVRLFDGIAGEWLAEIVVAPDDSSPKRKRGGAMVHAKCVQKLRSQRKDATDTDIRMCSDTWILFAPLKKPRAKFLMEKCTELGVTRLVPIITDRTDPGSTAACVGGKNMEKLAVQLVEASEQCERLDIPLLSTTLVEQTSTNDDDNDEEESSDQGSPWNVKMLLDHWYNEETSRTLLICRERNIIGSVPVLQALKDCNNDVAFLIGPEGGWSPEEELLFDSRIQTSDNIRSVSLGLLVLRAETAAVTAAAACVLWDDLK